MELQGKIKKVCYLPKMSLQGEYRKMSGEKWKDIKDYKGLYQQVNFMI